MGKEQTDGNWLRRCKVKSEKGERLEEKKKKTTPSGGFWIPESDDGTLLADVALGLVLGSLRGSHPVQDGQPHHGLGLQSHPV